MNNSKVIYPQTGHSEIYPMIDISDVSTAGDIRIIPIDAKCGGL